MRVGNELRKYQFHDFIDLLPTLPILWFSRAWFFSCGMIKIGRPTSVAIIYNLMVFDYVKKFDKLHIEICEVYSCQSFEEKFLNRVSADLEKLEMSRNLKETSESQAICPKS